MAKRLVPTSELQGHLHELHELLLSLLESHHSLVEVSQDKLTAMQRSDVAAIHRCVQREGLLTQHIRGQDTQRRRLMSAIGLGLGLSEVEARAMSLNQLAIRLDHKRSLQLRALARRLSDALAEICKVNTVVTLFARDMLAHYRFVFNEITKGMTEAPVYARQGRRSVDAVAQVFDATG